MKQCLSILMCIIGMLSSAKVSAAEGRFKQPLEQTIPSEVAPTPEERIKLQMQKAQQAMKENPEIATKIESQPILKKTQTSMGSKEEPTGPSIGASDRKILDKLLQKYNKELTAAYAEGRTIDDMIIDRQPFAKKGNKYEKEMSDLQKIKLFSRDAWQSPFINVESANTRHLDQLLEQYKTQLSVASDAGQGIDDMIAEREHELNMATKKEANPLRKEMGDLKSIREARISFDRSIGKYDNEIALLMSEPSVFGSRSFSAVSGEDVVQKLIVGKEKQLILLKEKYSSGQAKNDKNIDEKYARLSQEIDQLKMLLDNLQKLHEQKILTTFDNDISDTAKSALLPQDILQGSPLAKRESVQNAISFFPSLQETWQGRQETPSEQKDANYRGAIRALITQNRIGVLKQRINLLNYIKSNFGTVSGIAALRPDDTLDDCLTKINKALLQSKVEEKDIIIIEYLTLLRDVTYELANEPITKPLPTPTQKKQKSAAQQPTPSEQIQKIQKTGGVQVLPGGFVPTQEN